MTNNKLKVCLLTVGVYPVPATGGGAVETLTQMMAEDYDKEKCDFSLDIISVYDEMAKKQSEKISDAKFHYIKYLQISEKIYSLIKRPFRKVFGFAPIRLQPYYRKAEKIIKREKYDLIISENGIHYINPLKKVQKGKVVFHLHNDISIFNWQNPKRLLKNADLILTVSDYVKDGVEKTINNVPVKTVYNVTDTKFFSENTKREEMRKKLGYRDDDVVCIFVGRLIPEKGIDILIDAIKDTDDKIKLLVVGGTAFSDSSKNEFSEKLYKKAEGFEHKIKFTGYTEFKNLPDYYSAADFAVFPSQCPEAAGLVLIEAQSASKPVIVTKVGGMCEYVSEKSGITLDNGEKLLRELKSAITEFCISEEKRKEMGKNAKIFAENFDKKGYINKIVQSCNEV